MRLENKHMHRVGLAALALRIASAVKSTSAQDSSIRYGRGVPSAVRLINKLGLPYLATTQQEDGAWPGQSNSGSAITGICVMAFMASGEDPDFGPSAKNLRMALRRILLDQNAQTGHIPGGGHGSMLAPGLAVLALV